MEVQIAAAKVIGLLADGVRRMHVRLPIEAGQN
jgi:hypothetical protein